MKNEVERAARFANEAHRGQKRKYTGAPYISHPARVAASVMLLPNATTAMVCAAWLHDVCEDCDISILEIAEQFGDSIAALVGELTNTAKPHPETNRLARKASDLHRLTMASREAKLIKLIDRADNLREMRGAPDGFRAVYIAESRLLAKAIGDASAGLHAELLQAIDDLSAIAS